MKKIFERFADYFGAKSTKQKILFVIGVLILAALVFFFIKGNFFDNGSVSGETPQNDSSGGAKFHIGFIDIVALLAIVAGFVIRYIIRRNNGRK